MPTLQFANADVAVTVPDNTTTQLNLAETKVAVTVPVAPANTMLSLAGVDVAVTVPDATPTTQLNLSETKIATTVVVDAAFYLIDSGKKNYLRSPIL